MYVKQKKFILFKEWSWSFKPLPNLCLLRILMKIFSYILLGFGACYKISQL